MKIGKRQQSAETFNLKRVNNLVCRTPERMSERARSIAGEIRSCKGLEIERYCKDLKRSIVLGTDPMKEGVSIEDVKTALFGLLRSRSGKVVGNAITGFGMFEVKEAVPFLTRVVLGMADPYRPRKMGSMNYFGPFGYDRELAAFCLRQIGPDSVGQFQEEATALKHLASMNHDQLRFLWKEYPEYQCQWRERGELPESDGGILHHCRSEIRLLFGMEQYRK